MKNWGLRSKLIGLLAPFFLLFAFNVHAVNTFPSTPSCASGRILIQANSTILFRSLSCTSSAVSTTTQSPTCYLQCGTGFTSPSQPNYSCPSNSTTSLQTCTPNAGFNAFNINGTWTVIQEGQSCGSLTNPSPDSKCTCNTTNAPYKYSVAGGGYRCSPGSSEENKLFGVLTAAAGFYTSLAAGLSAGIAACIASLVCAGGLVATAIGSAFLGIGFVLDDSPSTTINPNAPLQVTISPAGSPTPDRQDNKIRIGGFGEIVPPRNATQDPQQSSVWRLTTGSQTVSVDTSNNTAIFSDSTTPNTFSAISTSGSSAPMISTFSASNWGTSSAGNPVSKVTTTRASLTRDSTMTQQQATTQTQYAENNTVTDNPPQMQSCVGQGCVVDGGSSGGGTGSGGTGTNPQPGTGGGDCDKEPQKCFFLTNISANTSGAGSEVVLTQISEYQDQKLNEYQSTLQGLADDFLNSELMTSEITEALTDMPSIGKFLQEQSENGQACAISFNSPYGNIEINLCPYQSQIQAAIAFGIFILLMISLRNMFLDRKSE